MFGNVTPEKVIRFTTICARLGACLPPSASARKSETICYEIYWWFSLCISLSIITPVMYDTYLNIGDVNSALLNTAELCPLCTGTLKMLMCKYNGQKLQACVSEVESFLKTVTRREEELLQRYVDECIEFYYFMLFCIVSTTLGFGSSPIFLPQPYPAHTSYPFEVNTILLKNILRALQMIALLQTGLLVAIDFVFSALVWFSAARFELLSHEFRQVCDTEQCCKCIQKHQEILRFAEDVNLVTRLIAYGLGCSTTIGIVCGGIQLLRDVSAMIKVRFVTFVIAGGLQLFVYSWPAEYLIETASVLPQLPLPLFTSSGAIGFAVYSSDWIGKSSEMTRLILIVMQRAKKPAIISVGDFLPMLSLSFYGSFLSTCFSYFTTLRATVITSAS